MGRGTDQRKSLAISEPVDFDEALSLTGYGKFHYEALVACALCVLIVGFQNGLNSYIFPAAQCELSLPSSHLGLLNVAFLVGGMLSSFFWGILADTGGRRNVLIYSSLLNALTSIILSIFNSTTYFVLCRFLNGFFIGAPGSVIFSYVGEFQPPKYRAGIICSCALFFTASWLMLPILAWLILPLDVNFRIGTVFIISPWRLFVIFIAIPELLLSFWFMRLPESPKFFAAKGKTRAAIDILKKMYASNTGNNEDDYPVKSLLTTVNIENHVSEKMACRGKNARILHEMWSQIKTLFKPPILYITFLTCAIMFTNMFGMFGLGLWLPELFVRFQQYQTLHPGEPVSVKLLASLSVEKKTTCDATFDISVIQNTIAMGVTSLVCSGLASWISTKVSIKTVPCLTMLMGGLAATSIYWLTSSKQNLVVACIYQATMIVANMSISGVVVDLFPTNVGAMAICLIMFVGRMGAMTSNVVFGIFMDKQCEIPIFTVAIHVLFGALLCLLIPVNRAKRSLENIVSYDPKTVEISLVTLP